MIIQPNPRVPEVEVDAMFVDRWSPRSFSPAPLDEKQIQALFEAARWAPSCFNDQPWLFRYAVSPQDRERFLSALVEKNQQWAGRAPLLILNSIACCITLLLSFHSFIRHSLGDGGQATLATADKRP